MRLDVDELRASAEKTARTEEAVAEASGEPSAETAAGMAPRNAMQEFVEMKRAERELLEVIEEERGPSLAEGLAEFLKDPEARAILKEVWYGPEGQAPVSRETKTTQSKLPEGDVATPDTTELTTDGGGVDDLDLDFSGVDPEIAYHLFESMITHVADADPDMTVSEMDKYAQLVQLSTAQAAAERPEITAKRIKSLWGVAGGDVKEQIKEFVEMYS